MLNASPELTFEGQVEPGSTALARKNDASLTDKERETINLREFYNLPDCGIKPIIAERNTTLGKIQSPSQRYLYEVRLMRALKNCFASVSSQKDSLITNENLTQLSEILALKQQDMSNAWTLFLRNSSELNTALSHQHSHLSDSDNHDFAIQSWILLSSYQPEQLIREDFSTTIEDNFEQHLKNITDFRTPARLRNDFTLISNNLPQITDFLISETAGFTCTPRKEKQQVEYLKNIFHMFFVDKIQPMTTRMNKWFYKLEPVLNELDLKEAIIKLNKQKQDYDSALMEHVQFWQQLFKRCGVSPV